MNTTNTDSLERAGIMVADALSLIDGCRGLYPNIKKALKEAAELLDEAVDYEDERNAHED